MKVIEGRLREPRLFVAYAVAVFRPGCQVPVFEAPPAPATDQLDQATVEDLELVVSEGQRRLDRQEQDTQRNHTRATSLLTATLAELAFFAAGLSTVFTQGSVAVVLWAIGVAVALSAFLGAVAILTTRAEYGMIDLHSLVGAPENRLLNLAKDYTGSVGVGDATNAARLTVLRDAACLALIAGALLLILVPFIAAKAEAADNLQTCAHGETRPCVLRSVYIHPTETHGGSAGLRSPLQLDPEQANPLAQSTTTASR